MTLTTHKDAQSCTSSDTEKIVQANVQHISPVILDHKLFIRPHLEYGDTICSKIPKIAFNVTKT